MLVDDRASAVSLPEVPLLGVLPGTGGLTRITDKRRVRRDHADIFCTTTEGVRGQRAHDWKLVDAVVKPARFAEHVQQRALALAAHSDRPADQDGVKLTPLSRSQDAHGYRYDTVQVHIDPRARKATLTVFGPAKHQPQALPAILAAGAEWWPLKMARELDDAILTLRANHLDIGLWILKTEGDPHQVLATDALLDAHAGHWFVRETIGMLRRTLARLEVSSRTLFALIEPDSCFAGTLLELALAADRSYMLHLPDAPDDAPRVFASAANFGRYPTVNGQTRLAARFYQDVVAIQAVQDHIGAPLDALNAASLGLVTATPDDIDWEDEIRIAIEERASLSPDALTGLEANLRFGPVETMETRIFGRLTAWQNWIFNRPNAVGEQGALKVFGSGSKARFDWDRV
ncbi:benzoyl-CoA-dihydrodiol lyase [Cupriavidus basilensis OR16]|uniref:Benzoyl-CoA-dihydrodiol lyase n=1 Tax=Cupriavidus basilensis OR16 TaxID=1127483 RepID=H1RXT1_9BURK|nr:benzoyl-CoA-dihydrodiol lyase [Cupriavidus basilensis OR16]